MKRIDYSFFSQNSNYPSHLTEREILNPFLVLEELFRATNSLGVLKDESWQFVSMVLHRNFYMGYDEPLTLYCTHKKLIKLLEALCLITGLRSTNKDQIKGAKKATFSKTRRYGSLEGILTPTPKEPGHSYETCQYIIEDRSYGEWKEELELWLFGGLEPFGGHFYKYELANYAELYLFIEAAYTIYLHSDNKLSKDEREELKKYITFSINADRPTKLSAQDINDPFETISCSFNFYPEVMALYQDFALCHDLLIKSNHWKTHFDYGILLLIFNDIERIIEAV